MKILIAAAAALFAFVACAEAASDRKTRVAEFRTFLNDYRQENLVLSMSVALAKDGKIVMLESIGWTDHDAE